MNSFEIFFNFGNAIRIIFLTGHIPQETDFVEFSDDDYKEYQAECGPVDGKMFAYKKGLLDDTKGVYAFSEEDKSNMLTAVTLLHNLDTEHKLTSDEDILKHAAAVLPDVFSEGSKYSCK